MTRQPITDRLHAVGHYNMNTRPDTWPSAGVDRMTAAADAYTNSSDFTQDALDWAGDHAHRYGDLVAHICEVYANSPECNAAIEDIADGVRAL